jgi:hypothetical protein
MMKTILTTLTLAATTFAALGQIPNRIGATPQELAAMAGRTLVVQLDPVDPEISAAILTEMKKKKNEAEGFKANYEASQQSYLDNIEAAMAQGWQFNEKVEFRTAEECKQLFLSKSPDHVVMKKEMYGATPFNSLSTSSGWRHYAMPFGVTALRFYRTDVVGANKKGDLGFGDPDFQMYMIGDYGPLGKALYSEDDLVATLKQAQKVIAWCIGREKPEDYFAYAKEQAELHCHLLQNKTVMAESNFNYKDIQESELREAYTRALEFVDHEQLGKIYRSGADDRVVFFAVPIGHVVGMGGESHIAYMKIAVDPSNDMIVHGSFPMAGGGVVRPYSKVDFKALAKCK